MRFVDEATIIVQSGDGGSGCASFRRERFIPRGGPDGGDGGKGGDVILKTTPRKRTLFHLQYKKHYRAKNGMPGQGRQRTGRSGDDLLLDVPLGTLVKDAQSEEILYDLITPDEQVTIVNGGRGGLGNQHFKSSTNRSPRYAQPGESGETRTIKLELKLLADVGIIGLPNAGKSTLIRAISSSQAKIANYPFTTLTPNLGVVQFKGAEPLVVADIPGLIEGAHQGAGLGIRFLKHVERTRILIHLIDAAALDPDNPLAPYRTVNTELVKYSGTLAQKPQLVVLNKLDIEHAAQAADLFCARFSGPDKIIRISAAGRQGLATIKAHMLEQLKRLDEQK